MNSLNKTFLPTYNSKSRNWFIIDCKGKKLGRLATLIATLLRGKIKPYYSPAIDTGDYVILINAQELIVNPQTKHFIVNSPGRPGRSLKIKSASDCLSRYTIQHAVKGMLSKSETKRLMRRLKIFDNEEHSHEAQNPVKIEVSHFYGSSGLTKKLLNQ